MVLLGKRIKELRKRYKLTQSNLADRLGVTVSSITAYENNSRQPSYEVLIKMADVFKVTIDSLLLDRSQDVIDVTGLNPEHIEQLQSIIRYFRNEEIIEAFCRHGAPDLKKLQSLKDNHPDILNNIREALNILSENYNKNQEH